MNESFQIFPLMYEISYLAQTGYQCLPPFASIHPETPHCHSERSEESPGIPWAKRFFVALLLRMTAEKRVSGRIPAFANIIPLWTVPLWACNWEGIWLVSIHKWPFATISTSIFGISCAAYVKYVSAQSLDFLDLAANCSFMNWKLQLAPSGVSGWTLVSFQTNRNKEFGSWWYNSY